jgi:lipopolysaccharide/colanic/teichoic acid biosynthesis glycosyltransferase
MLRARHALSAKAGDVLYFDAVDDYPLRHRVKPGMTGWAQVNGWRGETARIEQLKGRLDCDLYYVENWSLAFDPWVHLVQGIVTAKMPYERTSHQRQLTRR